MQVYSSADKGGNSAWKGFSSQTTYIAARLISEKNKTKKYFPESIEDLKITDANEAVIELIQVKNLSNDLSLSDLKPQKEGSFLKRALNARQNNSNLIVRLVSYGNIGSELLNWNKDKTSDTKEDNITTKLQSYGYSFTDIEWLRKNICIEKINESYLEKLIFVELEKNIETVISSEITFDILVNYVSRLSRHQMSTSKVLWQEKVRALSLSLAAISGWQNQFGKTILPLSEYLDFDDHNIEIHRNEYHNGSSALPQHILNNFDIIRPHWLDAIREGFQKKNIAIIHGASGQGKSSLAYRYLINNYAKNEIFIVNSISNQQQAIDIGAALRGLQKNQFNMIVYIDVRPFDKNWVWLVEHIFTHNLKVHVLVTIREEDYNRNPIDRNYIQYRDIELLLNRVEAQDLYERYPTDKHLSFEDSWKAFGEYNLLMEYTFYLRENESLKSRLQAQIDRLILEESNIDNWLLALLVISYAGRKEVPLDIKKLLKHIDIENHLKMLQIFNKEYWVRWLEDKRILSAIHPVRAMLLCEILSEKLLVDEEDVLMHSIQFTSYYPQTLLIDYFYKKNIGSTFLAELSNISFTTWDTYAGVLESLLWLSVWRYYRKYESIINEGNSLTNNTFAFLLITDITGYLEVDTGFFLDMLQKQNPTRFPQITKLLDDIKEKSINYAPVDEFIKNTIEKLPFEDTLSANSLTYCGFSLFWIAQRNFVLEETTFENIIDDIDYTDIFSVCEFCLGLQKHGWQKHYIHVLKNLKTLLTKQLNIVYLDDENSILQAYVINDISSNASNHSKTMLAVDALRLLYCEKDEYHITLIGSDILEGIPVLDNVKTIRNDHLPYKWITRLNNWFIKIDEYKYLLNDWKDVFDEVLKTRREIQEFATYLTKAIDEYFKKRRTKRFTDGTYLEKERQFKNAAYNIKPPRCTTNMYGISMGISNFIDITPLLRAKEEHKEDQKDKEYLSFNKAYNDYIQDMQNFLNQKDQLLIDKLKNKDTSNLGRLSYVNLMFMLEKFSTMSSLFEQEFSKFISDGIFDAYEEETIFLLGIMWEHVYNTPARIENSLLYNKKKELKSKKNVVRKFIKETIPNIQGVQEVIYNNDNEIFILLDIFHNDSFIEDIGNQFENLFEKLDYATFDYAVVSLLIKKICVQFCFDSVPTIGGFEISNLDFTKQTKDEFFVSVGSKAIGFDNYHWNISDSKTRCILTILGLIESIPIILKHIEDVLKYFVEIENEEYLISENFDDWKIKCDSLVKDLFIQINETCETLQEYLEHKEQKDNLNGFAEMTNLMLDTDDFLLNSTISEDKTEIEFSINKYKEIFIGIIDFLF